MNYGTSSMISAISLLIALYGSRSVTAERQNQDMGQRFDHLLLCASEQVHNGLATMERLKEETLSEVIQTELRQRIEQSVWSALDRLLDRDLFLLTADANERSITHRLALYLEDEFGEWNVDCEYNRDGHEPKELHLPLADIDSTDTNAITVYPDTIVQHCGERLPVERSLTSSR